MIKKSLSSGCPQEVYNLYSVDYFFFFLPLYTSFALLWEGEGVKWDCERS